MRNWIVAGALGLAVSVGGAGTGAAVAQEPMKASIGFYPGALISLPVFIAKDGKFFEKNGLDAELVPIPNGPAMTSAVASGSVTFVNNSWDNLITAVDKGLPVQGIAGSTVKTPFSLLVRKGIPLAHAAEGYPAVIKDLAGKNWGVLALGVSIHFMAQTILTDAGFKPADVTFLAVGLPNTARPAMQRGTIDTYLAIEPFPAIAAATGEGTVVVDLAKNEGPTAFHDLGYNGWWASTTTIKDKPELVARFDKSLEDAYCWFSSPDHIDDVVTILKRYAKVPELSDAEYKAMVQHVLPTHGPEITAQTIATWSKLLLDNKQISAPKARADVIASIARESFSCPK